MEHVESTTTAEVMDGMVIDQEENTAQVTEIPAEVVAEELLAGEDDQGASAQEETEAEPAQEEKPDDDLRAQIEKGVNGLFEQGWTGEELMTFSQDPQAKQDIAGGKSVADAAMAYLRRALAGALKDPQPRAEAGTAAANDKGKKHGVPTVKSGASAAAKESTAIEDMDDEAFARFSKRAQDLARMGKKVRIK